MNIMQVTTFIKQVLKLGVLMPTALGVGFLYSHIANAQTDWISCNPVGIQTYDDRVHVRCAESIGGVEFFAASTSDPARAARILSVISTAQVAGRTLSILADLGDDPADELPGCLSQDCRIIRAVGFGQ